VRGWVAAVSVLGLLGLGVLPPEHLHAHEGCRLDVVHRHLTAHHQPGPGTRIEDDAAPRWLDSSYVNGDRVSHVHRGDTPVPLVSTQAPPETRDGLARPQSISIHDPPPGMSFGPRAPPFPAR